MTTMKKSVMTAAIIATLGLGAFGTATAFAASNPADAQHPMQNIVTAIAEKFHVSESDVQAVFDEQHEAMQTERHADAAERLAEAVADGKLTQTQADAIATHMESQQSFMEDMKDKTPEERRDAMKTHIEEQKAWAEENDIPAKFAPGNSQEGRGPGGMMRGRGMMGERGEQRGGERADR